MIRQATRLLSLLLLAEGVLVAVPLAPVPLLLEVAGGDLVVRVLGVRRLLVILLARGRRIQACDWSRSQIPDSHWSIMHSPAASISSRRVSSSLAALIFFIWARARLCRTSFSVGGSALLIHIPRLLTSAPLTSDDGLTCVAARTPTQRAAPGRSRPMSRWGRTRRPPWTRPWCCTIGWAASFPAGAVQAARSNCCRKDPDMASSLQI